MMLYLILHLCTAMVLLALGPLAADDRPFVPRNFQMIPTIESDVPFITCSVCKRAVRQLVAQVEAKFKSKRRPSELDFLEATKNLCDPLEEEGFWITHLDIFFTDNGDLGIRRMTTPGHCEEDCKTIASACKAVFDEADSVIAEALYLGKRSDPEMICSSSELDNIKGKCGQEPPIPVNWEDKGSEFTIKTKADFEREQKAAAKLLGYDVGDLKDAT